MVRVAGNVKMSNTLLRECGHSLFKLALSARRFPPAASCRCHTICLVIIFHVCHGRLARPCKIFSLHLMAMRFAKSSQSPNSNP